MEILASNNVVIKSNIDYEELDGLSRYIITRQEEIFDYLNLNTSKMCKIHILDKKEALDMLYKELIFTEQDKSSRKEVPSSIGSFLYEDDFFILNYEDYTNSYLHSKTTIDDYYAEVVAGIIPIFQKWRFGKLSDSTIINQGLAAYLSGQDKSDALLLMDTLQKKLDETIKLEEKLLKEKIQE